MGLVLSTGDTGYVGGRLLALLERDLGWHVHRIIRLVATPGEMSGTALRLLFDVECDHIGTAVQHASARVTRI